MVRRRSQAKRRQRKVEHGEERSAFDRLSLTLTLVAVSVFSIFTGYLVGQYAIRWVASPLGEIPLVEEGGVRMAESLPASTPAAAPVTASPARPEPAAGRAPAAAPAPQPAAPQGQSDGAARVYRVQVGRFTSREAAVRVAEALKGGTPPVPDAWVLFDQAAGEYRVQVGAFSNEARASEMVATLRAQQYEAFIAP